ncbi:MAG TPA: hypothetical protein VGC08_04055 [Pedobacter sp.]
MSQEGMNQTSPIVLRGISLLYLLLFIAALVSSGYLLRQVVQLTPIPLIGLLKYSLLCVLFLILARDALKAFTLKPEYTRQLGKSTRNFKWLFTIAILIAIAARLGFFNTATGKPVQVTFLQIGALAVLTLFCFWSDFILKEEETPPEI